MTLLTGWCMSPRSSVEQHAACIREYSTSKLGIVTCPCSCHSDQ